MTAILGDYIFRIKNSTYNVKLYMASLIISSLGLAMFEVLYNVFLQEVGFGEDYIGRVISMMPMAGLFFSIPFGLMGDKGGRKKSLLIGTIFVFAFMLSKAYFIEEKTILILSFLQGVSRTMIFVNATPFLAENSSPTERMHIFSVNMALMLISSTAGNFLGGFIPDILYVFGIDKIAAFNTTLIMAATLNGLSVIPIIFFKENMVHRVNKLSLNYETNDIITILKFALPQLIIGMGAGLFVPFMNLYFKNSFNLTATSMGTILSVGQITTAFATLMAPWLTSRFGKIKAILIVQFTSIPFLLTLGYTQTLTMAIIAYLIRGALMNSGNPMVQGLLMEKITDKSKGLASSVTGMSFNVGWAICPVISGQLVKAHGYDIIFYIAAATYVIGASVFYLLFNGEERKKNVGSIIIPGNGNSIGL
jgi:MFS family permease